MPVDQYISQGIASFTEGIMGGLKEYQQKKSENEFLTGSFETMMDQRKSMNMPLDPDLLTKFQSGSIGAKRGIVSTMATEMDQIAKLEEARGRTAYRQAQLNQYQSEAPARELQLKLDQAKLDQIKSQESTLTANRSFMARFADGVSRPATGPDQFSQYQDSFNTAVREFPGVDPQFAASAANALKPGMDTKQPIQKLQEYRDMLEASGDSDKAAEVNAVIASMGPKGTIIRTNPDGTTEIIQGANMKDAGAPTTGTMTEAQKSLTGLNLVAQTMTDLRKVIDPSNFGFRGGLQRLQTGTAAQLYPSMADPKAMEAEVLMDRLRAQVFEAVAMGNISEKDREMILAKLPSKSILTQSADKAYTQLKKFWEEIEVKAKAYSKTAGIKPPIWTMKPDEIIDLFEAGEKSGLSETDPEYQRKYPTRKEAADAIRSMYPGLVP